MTPKPISTTHWSILEPTRTPTGVIRILTALGLDLNLGVGVAHDGLDRCPIDQGERRAVRDRNLGSLVPRAVRKQQPVVFHHQTKAVFDVLVLKLEGRADTPEFGHGVVKNKDHVVVPSRGGVLHKVGHEPHLVLVQKSMGRTSERGKQWRGGHHAFDHNLVLYALTYLQRVPPVYEERRIGAFGTYIDPVFLARGTGIKILC